MLFADPLDILFENRNKSYGAYPLRKYYAQRLYISMGVTFSIVVLSSFFFLYFKTNTPPILFNPAPDITPIDLTPPPKPTAPPVRPIPPRPMVSTATYTPPLIVHTDIDIQSMAKVEDLKDAAIGIKTIAGDQDDGESPDKGNPKGEVVASTGQQSDDKPRIFDNPEIMPEFPGGIEALKRYLSRNLRMPDNSAEPGTVTKVIARFVVGADGKVNSIEIIQAADKMFNEEVKRVISKMPDWKPGSQNHRNVAVYFNLPVNFVSAE